MLRDVELKRCKPTTVDKHARLLSGSQPLYPIGEMLSDKSGNALLEIEVAADGTVKLIRQDAENKWFANHAAIAMRDWQIQPAYKSGQAVPVVCKMMFSFQTFKEAERRGQTSTPGQPGAPESK